MRYKLLKDTKEALLQGLLNHINSGKTTSYEFATAIGEKAAWCENVSALIHQDLMVDHGLTCELVRDYVNGVNHWTIIVYSANWM